MLERSNSGLYLATINSNIFSKLESKMIYWDNLDIPLRKGHVEQVWEGCEDWFLNSFEHWLI